MDDREIVNTIKKLAEQEHQLELTHTGKGLDAEERRQLREIEVQLDQCWDLLRQRRARRDAGQDPDEAQQRSVQVVEHYQQ